MSECGTRLRWLGDARLSPLALSPLPAWLWSADATRVLWANATGAAIFGARTPAALLDRKFDTGQPAAAQIAATATTLAPGAAPRLERLRGFGAGVGRALTCQCAQIALADGTAAILVAATERAGPDLPLNERIRRVLVDAGEPVAAFAADGTLIHMPADARASLGAATSLAVVDAQALAAEALAHGQAAGDSAIGPLTLTRVNTEAAPVLLATPCPHRHAEFDQINAAPIAADAGPAREAAPGDGQPGIVLDQDVLQIVPEGVRSPSETQLAPDVPSDHRDLPLAPQDPTAELEPQFTSDDVVAPTAEVPLSEPHALTNSEQPSPPVVPDAPPALAPHVAEPMPEPPSPAERRHPLRFVWQIDAEDRYTIGSDEFVALIGPKTATLLARPWPQIAAALELDPEGQIERAIATHDTWSGLSASWPVDDFAGRLTVELSGLPVFDRERVFRGYRGFGVCRDLARLTELAQVRHAQARAVAEGAAAAEAAAAEAAARAEPAPSNVQETAPAALARPDDSDAATAAESPPDEPADGSTAAHPLAEQAAPVDEQQARDADPVLVENVVPFRAAPEPPSLNPVERRAFRELSRRLAERLTAAGTEYHPPGAPHADADTDDSLFAPDPTLADLAEAAKAASAPNANAPVGAAFDANLDAGVFDEPEPVTDARAVFDRFPLGILVYRLNDLLYANRAFLDWAGHESVAALAEAGGLDSLVVAPGAVAIEEGGHKPFNMESPRADTPSAQARLFLVPWDGDSAFALVTTTAVVAEKTEQPAVPPVAHPETDELRAILEIASDGIIVFGRDGRLASTNRKAQALFGYGADDFGQLVFVDLFAPESRDQALDYLDGLENSGVASVLQDGREVTGRTRSGDAVALFMTIGRVGETGEKYCAVFRDITKWKKAEEQLTGAKHQAEKQSSAKSDFLAKISHEIRTPLNAIIGFSEVMMEERFGPVGNDRYRQYMRDIHASGGHLISLINDLLDLSKIEAGKLELAFTGVSVNDLTHQCVAIMQPQANRERIIIRTSLAPKLPQVVADARSVRQIVLNLLSNSIKFTGAGGQVIVSTALTDAGEVVLRVRDTGAGMSEQDLATALEPFRQLATSTRFGSGGTGLGLPLTKALAEANRATFNIKSSPGAGTLVEITFAANRVLAE